jgi:nitroreductase
VAAFAYNSHVTDRGSGLPIVAGHPGEAPRRWRAYLDGATARYRHHGVESALERDRVEDGRTVSLFWVALDGNRVVAGLRCHGPLASPTEARALVELGDHPHLADVHADLEAAVDQGVVEIKGAWVELNHASSPALSQALARCHLHSMEWFAARFAICTAPTHAQRVWCTAGAVCADHLAPVAYPDARFATRLLWWDRHQVAARAEAAQLRLFATEAAELAAAATDRSSPTRACAPPQASTAPCQSAPGDAWRPLVLTEGDGDDEAVLAAVRADPAVAVRDGVADQRGELIALQPTCPVELLAEPPRWVYYPWRQALVRLLGPAGFRRLRHDRNRNKLTDDEQQHAAAKTVGVVGLSVGHTIAHTLALEGLCGRLVLADFDEIATSNLNRLPADVFDLGVNKAVATARRLAELDPYLPVDVWPHGVDADVVDAFLADVDVVIEECDSLDIKLRLRDAARHRRVPVLMETSDRGLLDVERFDTEPDRPAFHGLVAGLTADDLAGLTTRAKAPYVLSILEPGQLSPRMAGSMAEIDYTVTTWPQLGGEVALGGASVAAALRRLARGQALPSGRLRLDLDAALDELAPPAQPAHLHNAAPVPRPVAPDDPHEAIAHAAHLAPSGGNTQPWALALDDDELRLWVDHTKSSTLDQGFRGSYTALGAALLNARAAASAHARLGPIAFKPRTDGHDDEVVAAMAFGDELDLDLAELSSWVTDRHTNRKPGEPAVVAPATVEALRAAAAREGGAAHVVTHRETLAACAAALAESDRLRYLTPWLHAELMSELRWPGHDALESGIDVRTLELDAAERAKLAVATRADVMAHLSAWDAGAALGEITHERVVSSSALVAVTVTGTDPAAYVRGGAALERVWLEAQRAGLGVQPVSPVSIYALADADYVALVGAQRAPQLRALDQRLCRLLGLGDGEQLVLLLRLSHASAASLPSGRQPLEEVLVRFRRAGPSQPASA